MILIVIALLAIGTAAMLVAERIVEAHDRGMNRVLGKSTTPDELEPPHAWLFRDSA